MILQQRCPMVVLIILQIQIQIQIQIQMTTELADGRAQENLAPPANESLGLEAGACVKVIATSRRTRQN